MDKLLFGKCENANNSTVPIRVSDCNYKQIKEISNKTDYPISEIANRLISHSLKLVEFDTSDV